MQQKLRPENLFWKLYAVWGWITRNSRNAHWPPELPVRPSL